MQMQQLQHDSDEKVALALAYYGRIRIAGSVADPSPMRRDMMLAYWHLRMVLWQWSRRVFDCVVALLFIIMALPLMVVTAIAIKLDSPGPIIFRQTRVGKQGKSFTLYKFRSMSVDAEKRKNELLEQNEADGPLFKMRHDPRMTRVGFVIRKLSIDELPQFFNVVMGDMNLVGPRPPIPEEVAKYRLDHLRRLEATPGITGLAQIMGRSNLDFETWVALDRQYIAHQSLRKDLAILLKTVPVVLLRRGAY